MERMFEPAEGLRTEALLQKVPNNLSDSSLKVEDWRGIWCANQGRSRRR